MFEKEKQETENRNMIRDAKMEAYDMYKQRKEGNPICIPKPCRCTINIYDESTALTNEDYNRIRSEEFKRLIENII